MFWEGPRLPLPHQGGWLPFWERSRWTAPADRTQDPLRPQKPRCWPSEPTPGSVSKDSKRSYRVLHEFTMCFMMLYMLYDILRLLSMDSMSLGEFRFFLRICHDVWRVRQDATFEHNQTVLRNSCKCKTSFSMAVLTSSHKCIQMLHWMDLQSRGISRPS